MVQYTQDHFNASFAALSDVTRRGVLEQLARADASITELADKFDMTLTGMKKHVGVLEQAGSSPPRRSGACAPASSALPAGGRSGLDREVPPALGRALRRAGQVVEELKRKEKVDGRKKRK
jgi:DNA-binding transcriptional ArsR family regulator